MRFFEECSRIGLMVIGLGLGNSVFYRLMNGDCYQPKTIGHYIGFSMITIGCSFGYFFVASRLSNRYKKTAVVLLLPAFTIIPGMMSGWFPSGTNVSLLLAVLALGFVYRKNISYALESMDRKRRS